MIRISKYQLFCMIVFLQIGSTTLFAVGIEAKQDAWLAVLTALLIGFILLWIYTEIQKHFPDKDFCEIIIQLLGKFIGIPLVLLYSYLFFFFSALNIREFSDLVGSTFLQDTPLVVVISITVITIVLMLFMGLEVVSRTMEITFLVFIFFLFSVFILIALTGRVHLIDLTPVLAEGFGPVIKAAYPKVVCFPFGQSLIFFMYWRYVNSEQGIRKTSFLALGISGLVITISVIIITTVLGVNYASSATIPLLEVIKLINIGNILSNLDSVGVILMLLGGLYKMILIFYGSILSFNSIAKIQNHKWLIVIWGVIMIWFCVIIHPSYTYYIWYGFTITLPYVESCFLTIIPPLLLIIHWLKYSVSKKGN